VPTQREVDPRLIPERLLALDGVQALREAAAGTPIYLVGGAVRDLLLGEARADLDVAVDGEPAPVAHALGGELVEHQRFETATVRVGELEIDLARTRAEEYPSAGALPEVRPAPILEDLARRDFTINAMAVPLLGDPELIDPHGGLDDLRAGLLRVLHDLSLVDDPTRALRAARYAARLDLALEKGTERLVRAADLDTVSEDRIVAELGRIAAEPAASGALALLEEWGVLELDGAAALAGALERLFEQHPAWSEFADLPTAILLAAAPGEHAEQLRRRADRLAKARPGSPAEIYSRASGHAPPTLALARAAGAEWLDDYADRLRHAGLEINGYDLIDAGVPEGPAVGRGLNAALEARLNGEISSADQELEVALEAAAEP
jgi:tRNA nucleotidyltransferase (CCA-adding enzyme)